MTKKNVCCKNGKKGVFVARKGLCTISNKVKIRKIGEKRGKIRKTWSMTKKVIRNFCRENGKFSRKSHLGPRKFFPSPQTRRVSATAFYPRGGPNSIANFDGGDMAGFAPLDPPLLLSGRLCPGWKA